MKCSAALILGLALFAMPAFAQTDTSNTDAAITPNQGTGGQAAATSNASAGNQSGTEQAAGDRTEEAKNAPAGPAAKDVTIAGSEGLKPHAPAPKEIKPATAVVEGNPSAEKKQVVNETPAGPKNDTGAPSAPASDQSNAPQAVDKTPDKKKAVKKAPAAKKETTASTGDTTDQDADGTAKKTAKKKSSPSGVAVTKEGGKTCSGRDEYRVCW